MSLVTGFIVFSIVFWSFIAILALIFARDHFVKRLSEPGKKVTGPIQPK